jgi:hypothetical protein
MKSYQSSNEILNVACGRRRNKLVNCGSLNISSVITRVTQWQLIWNSIDCFILYASMLMRPLMDGEATRGTGTVLVRSGGTIGSTDTNVVVQVSSMSRGTASGTEFYDKWCHLRDFCLRCLLLHFGQRTRRRWSLISTRSIWLARLLLHSCKILVMRLTLPAYEWLPQHFSSRYGWSIRGGVRNPQLSTEKKRRRALSFAS